MTDEREEPRLLERARRLVDRANAGETFPDDRAVQALLDEPDAVRLPITPEDDPGIACATWVRDWPGREWLIKGWLPVGRLGMLSGRGGCGKSRLVLQLAARMARRKALSGHVLKATDADVGKHAFELLREHCGPVVFASWEDESDEVGRRLKAMAADKLVDVPGLQGRLVYLDLRGKGPVWAPGTEKHVSTVASLTQVGGRVRATAEALGARLLVLDSLAGAYASDENVRPLVRAFCSDWDAWGTQHRCAVLLIAHPPKRPAGSRGSNVDADTDDDFSGSTDWHNAVRWRWSLGNADTGKRSVEKGPRGDVKRRSQPVSALALTCQKASYGPRPEQSLFLAPSDQGVGWKAILAQTAAQRAIANHRGRELEESNADPEFRPAPADFA
ncbi:MAG: AAA family ATPase [Acidobacteria bacterium]|nr:AAA family ATPase [Acidobacteriota bacterium]